MKNVERIPPNTRPLMHRIRYPDGYDPRGTIDRNECHEEIPACAFWCDFVGFRVTNPEKFKWREKNV